MVPFSRHSLRRKVMLVVVATTAVALLLNGAALLVYEINAYRDSWVRDLSMQADIIGQSSKSALAFNDPNVAAENLHMLKLRPDIDVAVIYRADGQRFASYRREGAQVQEDIDSFALPGHRFTSREVILGQTLTEDGRVIGHILLRSRHELGSRVVDYLLILASVMGASLVIALLVSYNLQRTVTDPMLEVARLARQIMEGRDFRLRAKKVSEDEVGELVDAFNGMLQEVDNRTSALEASNQHLRVEMDERHRAEEALRDAARAKDAFLATLAHELRNPLAPISTAVEVMSHLDDGKVDARQNALGIMRRQVQQLVRLIDDLLDVSRISTGKLLLKIQWVDVLAVLRSAEETAAPLLKARGHTLTRCHPPGPVLLAADHVRLAQVFANLINNAAKYTPPGGQVLVSVEIGVDVVIVHVKDNGIGISPEMQSAVFELFFQADQSIERGNSGLGLGLTLTRQLVELHGGSIEVHSEGLGQGATFSVTLPLSQPGLGEAPPMEQVTDDTTEAPTESAPIHILIADDNHDFVTSLSTLLMSRGHRVSCAHSGRQAFDLAREQPPDLVLLDIGMPELNGYELAARLREHPATRHALLVAVTGWGQPHDRHRAEVAGLDVLLVKPVHHAEIEPLIARARRQAQPDTAT
jgi:signal transduction histidine kinase/ActR/RegA family two-component response regulator